MISANGGLPAHRYPPQVTPRWPRGSEPASLFPLTKFRRVWPEGSGPAWGKGTEGRYPFCASWRYGGVGAGALPLGSMRYKHDSEDNEDEDTNLQKILVYKKM